MTHKADGEFFGRKREWSTRKDEILRCYISAYLPKIMALRKPVLIVDGFAGPGKFQDGHSGSPLIICECIQQTLEKNLQAPQPVNLVCIEKIPELFETLDENLRPFSFASARAGSFSDYANQMSKAAQSKSVFLYVDPFTVEGLVWAELDRIFEGLKSGNSVEILLNLNSASFIRRGLAVLKAQLDEMGDEDGEPVEAGIQGNPSVETLNAVAGGKWWQDLISKKHAFPKTVTEFTRLYCDQMRDRFKQVAFHPIKAAPHHKVAKYFLVFGTRHLDGLALMNDEMAKSRSKLADMAKSRVRSLFEARSEELVPDLERLPELILDAAQTKGARKDVINKVIQRAFCDFRTSEIRSGIETLLKAGKLQSETGKFRINDDVKIWVSQTGHPSA